MIIEKLFTCYGVDFECFNMLIVTSLNVDSLIGSKLPTIELTCLTITIGLEI